MAEISVGTQLNYKGQACICTRYERRTVEMFAQVSSALYLEQQRGLSNSHYLNMEISNFEEGDLICLEQEFIELTSPGKNLFFIYTKYKAWKKGESNGNEQGSQAVPDQSPGGQTQATD